MRARARRPIETAMRAERSDVPRSERPSRPRSRAAIGPLRATDAASPVLERAAAAERAYVVKDSRRLGIVVAVMLVLLTASGIAVERLF